MNASNAAQPTDLTATRSKDSDVVTLSWTAPDNSVTDTTEDFEDTEVFPEFDLGGITATNHTGALGDWTLYDGNGLYCYGFNGIEVPNLGEPSAWMTLNPSSSQLTQDLSESYAPYSGSQFLISVCVADGTPIPATDHWLISPELPGVAQTISFMVRTITAQYGAETFEVLASSTDNQVESFEKVAELSTDVTTWTEFTADLPAGTKYFAIRHTSTDIFGMMVDNISFLAGGAEPTGYNVYVDEEFAKNTTETTAEVEFTQDKEYKFSVTAVYANDVESAPVSVSISLATAIEQLSATGKAVNVYTLDGKHIGTMDSTKGLRKGAYVIDNKKVLK